MTTEDLQKKYRDKTGEIKPQKVPLAADAAHLLTEYLDSISVEFVKQGVAEPYRITREYEEIFVQELQKLGSSKKLTYEIVSKMLENYGTPKSLVSNYIAEHNPPITEILPQQTEGKAERLRTMLQDERNLSRFAKFRNFLIWIILSGIIGSQLSFLAFMLQERFHQWEFATFVWICIPFIALEIFSGWKGTGIETKYYHTLREIIRFLSSFTVLWGIWWFVDSDDLNDGLFLLIIPWILIYSIGALKDHSDLLLTSSPREKPVARFFLPSYLLFGLAYLMGLFGLLINNNSTRVSYQDSSFTFVFFTFLFAFLGLIADTGRKYPFSFKKLGYNLLFFVYPILIFSFIRSYSNYYWDRYLVYDRQAIITALILWTILFGLSIPLLFREEIKTQLAAYQNSLENYRSE